MTITHYFFGKNCIIDRELQNRTNLERIIAEKNIDSRANLFVNQIHGAEIIVIDSEYKIHGNQGLPKADALVTNLKNLVIGIVTADCAPVLFFDEEKKIIAAAHAGWRGAKLGVLQSTISAMRKLGAEKISAIVGPMIQQKSYEVSQEFFDDFLAEDLANKIFFRKSAKLDKWLFDLPSYVEKKLRAAGISEIKNDGIDTYENAEKFFSFRRSTHLGKSDCGRNVSVIVIS